jgi:hypothetical protein
MHEYNPQSLYTVDDAPRASLIHTCRPYKDPSKIETATKGL